MPLTPKGEEIMSAMQEQYGPAKGKSVFYASKNAGTISGVDTLTSQAVENITAEAFRKTQEYRLDAQQTDSGTCGMDAIDHQFSIHDGTIMHPKGSE